jgi:TatD DNase family protein
MESQPTFIDTHAHLYLQEFDSDRDLTIQRAVDAGVKKIYLPTIDRDTIGPMLEMVKRYPGVCFPMIGLHPCSVGPQFEESLDLVRSEVQNGQFAAIGEIGTDLYWDKTFRDEQEACFREQLLLAKACRLPVAVHSRETLDWNIELVRAGWEPTLRGVFHCFTGSISQAQEIIEMGFFLGIGGVVTFKNSGLAEVIAQLPLKSMVLETDAPYLTPHPHRGKRNESGFLNLIAQKIADVQRRSLSEVAEVTTDNAIQLFSESGQNTQST